jgi:hypothetical protein
MGSRIIAEQYLPGLFMNLTLAGTGKMTRGYKGRPLAITGFSPNCMGICMLITEKMPCQIPDPA